MRWLARILGIGFWWITKWGVIAVIAESTWTFFTSLAKGLSFEQAMVWGMAAFGAGGLFVIALAYGFDYVAGLLPEVIARRKLAGFLSDLYSHGDRQIELGAIVQFWSEIDGTHTESYKDRLTRRNKLRHIKTAARQGYLPASLNAQGNIAEASIAQIPDAVRYFRSWDWLKVRDANA